MSRREMVANTRRRDWISMGPMISVLILFGMVLDSEATNNALGKTCMDGFTPDASNCSPPGEVAKGPSVANGNSVGCASGFCEWKVFSPQCTHDVCAAPLTTPVQGGGNNPASSSPPATTAY